MSNRRPEKQAKRAQEKKQALPSTSGAAEQHSDAWEPPIPLTETPTVPPFPVDILPVPLARLVTETALAMRCPVDFAALPMLVIAGGAAGASRAVKVKSEWAERPLLYGAIVGEPGDGKTPALDFMARPVYEAQRRYKSEFDDAVEAYEKQEEMYKAAKRDGREAEKPKKPTLHRVQVDDATVEALAKILSQNPRGITMVKDELTAWVTGANEYKGGKGSDRQFWLKNWAGASATVDRKSSDIPLVIPHPFVAVVGGIQPDLLACLRDEKGRMDGFLDRILFAFPEQRPPAGWTWEEISPDSVQPWRDTVEQLLRLNQEPHPLGPRPHYVQMDRDARREFEWAMNVVCDEQRRNELPSTLKGVWAKWPGHTARLALIVHLLRWVLREVEEENVDAESVRRATRLVSYFQAHARKVHCVIGADPEIAEAKIVLRWIQRNGLTEFRRWGVQHGLQTETRFRRSEDLDRPLQRLVKHGFLREQLQEKRAGGGRPAGPVYVVNPLLGSSEESEKTERNPDAE